MPPPEIAPFLNYGVLGLVVLAIFFGWVWPRPAVDKIVAEKEASIERLQTEKDRLIEEKRQVEAQRDAAVELTQDKIVPLLTSFNTTALTLIPLLQEIVRDDDRRR